MRNDRDWRAVDRARRQDDWSYGLTWAGKLIVAPFAITLGLLMIALGLAIEVIARLFPYIVAGFIAIILARCIGVLS